MIVGLNDNVVNIIAMLCSKYVKKYHALFLSMSIISWVMVMSVKAKLMAEF